MVPRWSRPAPWHEFPLAPDEQNWSAGQPRSLVQAAPSTTGTDGRTSKTAAVDEQRMGGSASTAVWRLPPTTAWVRRPADAPLSVSSSTGGRLPQPAAARSAAVAKNVVERAIIEVFMSLSSVVVDEAMSKARA